jgi:hypothetical protein
MQTTSRRRQRSGSCSLPSDALQAVALLTREQLLSEQVGLANDSRQRLKIEAELSQIRRDLERLGFASPK